MPHQYQLLPALNFKFPSLTEGTNIPPPDLDKPSTASATPCRPEEAENGSSLQCQASYIVPTILPSARATPSEHLLSASTRTTTSPGTSRRSGYGPSSNKVNPMEFTGGKAVDTATDSTAPPPPNSPETTATMVNTHTKKLKLASDLFRKFRRSTDFKRNSLSIPAESLPATPPASLVPKLEQQPTKPPPVIPELSALNSKVDKESASTSSFEKELVAQAEKIGAAQAHLETIRMRSRRVRGLATFYLMLAYLLYGIVTIVVRGQNHMSPLDWTGLCAGPVVIYAFRQSLTVLFNWKSEVATLKLEVLLSERAKTVKKLKEATRFDSTQQLLARYGGDSKLESPVGGDKGKKHSEQSEQHDLGEQVRRKSSVGWTRVVPPPTANVRRQVPESLASAASPVAVSNPDLHRVPVAPMAHVAPVAPATPATPAAPGASDGGLLVEVASPHAPFPNLPMQTPSHGAQYEYLNSSSPRWYDRVLDLLLGDDEMTPSSRIVLICQHCRLVNGQAPPGTKTLAEMGSWRCMGCGYTNGVVEEKSRTMREILERQIITDSLDSKVVDKETGEVDEPL